MSKKIGFIDESGNKSIQYEKGGVSSFFVISAIIIDENQVADTRNKFQSIAKKHTLAPEIKSSAKAFRNIENRIRFLQEISELEFKIYSIVVNKSMIYAESGLQYQDVFYKYTNGLLDRELYDYYPYLELVSDQHGSESFMRSFVRYVERNHIQKELFKSPTFKFKDSKEEPLIQLADIIAGSIARCYEPEKFDERNSEIKEILNQKILHTREWPEVPLKFWSKAENQDEEYNQELVDFIFHKIDEFRNKKFNSDNLEIRNQLICLNYLVYRFKMNPYSYVYSDEILKRINISGISVTKRVLNKDIITRLRDNKILITSSSNGYKIACCKADLIRFYNNYSTKIIPMIDTISTVDVVVKSATYGKLSLLNEPEFKLLYELIKTIEANSKSKF